MDREKGRKRWPRMQMRARAWTRCVKKNTRENSVVARWGEDERVERVGNGRGCAKRENGKKEKKKRHVAKRQVQQGDVGSSDLRRSRDGANERGEIRVGIRVLETPCDAVRRRAPKRCTLASKASVRRAARPCQVSLVPWPFCL